MWMWCEIEYTTEFTVVSTISCCRNHLDDILQLRYLDRIKIEGRAQDRFTKFCEIVYSAPEIKGLRENFHYAIKDMIAV